MTDAPRAQSEPAHELPPSVRDAVVYLVAASYDAGKHGATDSSSVRDATEELGFVLACALQRKDAEIARLNAGISELGRKGLVAIVAEEKIIADCRAENAKLTAELAMATDAANKGDRARVNAGAMADEIAECRAENAALAKLADELSVDHRDDDTFDAGVRYALFILGFEKEAVEANDASKALRAGQQKE